MTAVTSSWMMHTAFFWLLVTAVVAASPPTVSTAGLFGNSNTGTNGAEVSNNLISDLAPLLALFGERFAQQFMSFSTSWIDSLLFAVAPLGIITAIVSAVRVAGPSWLRTLVGRSRETRAAAEVELMSSTSDEVCEIWNGDAIVRVIGAPEIVELLYFENLPPQWETLGQGQASQDADPDKEPQPTIQPTKPNASSKIQPTVTSQIFTLQEAEDKNLVIKIDRTSIFQMLFENPVDKYRQVGRPSSLTSSEPVQSARNTPSDLERGSSYASGASSTAKGLPTQRRKHRDPLKIPARTKQTNNKNAPNISLNLAVHRKRWELHLATLLGIVVQVAVLVIAGFASYHSGWNLTQGGSLVQGYAYPLTSGGTILLVLGMFICASVIDQSTTEEIYKKHDRIKNAKLYLLWLQRGKLISDQTFESYAMITKEPAQELWISSRQQSGEEMSVSSLAGTFAALGTFISISGFILQFIGLRGSHWVVSIAQLAATILMTAVRAFIRRGLSKQPVVETLTKGFELDWLASAISTNQGTFRSRFSSVRTHSRQEECQINPVSVQTARLDRVEDGPQILPTNSEDVEHKVVKPPTLRVFPDCKSFDAAKQQNAKEVILLRQRLGSLTQWTNPASGAAVSVTKSMNLVLNTLLQKNTKDFTWGIDVFFDNKRQRVDLTAKKEGERFCIASAEIEALLSLWLRHVVLQEQKRKDSEANGKGEESNSKRDNDRLEQEALKQNLRILGPHSNSLRQDLKWWLPSDSATVLRMSKAKQKQDVVNHSESKELQYSIDYHRIIGFSGTKDAVPELECDTVDFKYSICSGREGGATVDKSKPGHTDNTETENERFLAVISTTERELLFAQHIFTAFMWAIAPKITRIRRATKASQSMTNVPTAWQNRELGNEVIQNLANGISDTGLASKNDAFLCIIPPLSIHDKLPSYAAVDEVVQSLERDGHDLGKCTEAYHELLSFVNQTPLISRAFITRTAVATIVHLRRMEDMLQIYRNANLDTELAGQFSKLQSSFSQLLRKNPNIQEYLTATFKLQDRWKDYQSFMGDAAPVAAAVLPEENLENLYDCLKDTGHFSHLHESICRNNICKPTNGDPVNNEGDCAGWTPLHYAVLRENKGNVE
ncbi:hypothetical protein BZA77DRAFT_73218 [Pyronema omphalodes]|nr:hypothetical protein BZA77DRAFT_73218 [Pyronema omphalodes]